MLMNVACLQSDLWCKLEKIYFVVHVNLKKGKIVFKKINRFMLIKSGIPITSCDVSNSSILGWGWVLAVMNRVLLIFSKK